MLAFWLDPAQSLPTSHPRGHVSIEEALARALQGTKRRVVRPLRTASLIIAEGSKHDWRAVPARWGLVPNGTSREAMRETGMRNLAARFDSAATNAATGPLWQRQKMGEFNRHQCLVPVSGWIDNEGGRIIACKPEGGWATLAAIYDIVLVDGKPVLTFTILMEQWRTTRSDALKSSPVIIGENCRTSWLHAENPHDGVRWARDGGGPVDRRILRPYKTAVRSKS